MYGQMTLLPSEPTNPRFDFEKAYRIYDLLSQLDLMPRNLNTHGLFIHIPSELGGMHILLDSRDCFPSVQGERFSAIRDAFVQIVDDLYSRDIITSKDGTGYDHIINPGCLMFSDMSVFDEDRLYRIVNSLPYQPELPFAEAAL